MTHKILENLNKSIYNSYLYYVASYSWFESHKISISFEKARDHYAMLYIHGLQLQSEKLSFKNTLWDIGTYTKLMKLSMEYSLSIV